MQRKQGFVYVFSKALNQEIAMSEKTGIVYCEDGTKYTFEEMQQIKTLYGEIPMSVHLLKKHFGGQIVDISDKQKEKIESPKTTQEENDE